MKRIISALVIAVMMLSMICVSSSAAGTTYLNADFSTWTEDQFYSHFMVGEFHVNEDEKVLYGYSEAKALQSMYNDPEGFFDNTLNTWLTYDASITFSMADDDLSELERNVSMSYCNDNLKMKGLSEGRQFISFIYNIDAGQFEASASLDGVDVELGAPIQKDLDIDGNTFYTFGMSVQKNHIRFFCNDELLYDIDCTAYCVGEAYNSPFFFWNNGNYLCIKNVTVASDGYLYPATPAPAESTTPKVTTTATSIVEVTDKDGNTVTDESGNKVTETVIVTEPPVADTNTGAVAGGNSTTTGDSAFIVAFAMVATLGCAIIVKKVSVK